MADKIYKIYKITNLLNNKIYIGCTGARLSKRFSNHFWTKDNNPLHIAMQKLDRKFFIIEVIEESDDEDYARNTLEPKYIKMFNSVDSDIGYNIQTGGLNIPCHSEETKKIIGTSAVGRKKTKEGLASFREKRLGHKVTKETRKKISNSLKRHHTERKA
jgi:group I intron endonuclease